MHFVKTIEISTILTSSNYLSQALKMTAHEETFEAYNHEISLINTHTKAKGNSKKGQTYFRKDLGHDSYHYKETIYSFLTTQYN
mgnify:CR=1 FL=1